MRLIFATFLALFVSAIGFFTVKFWGQSQAYIDYNHPIYKLARPLVFHKPKFADISNVLKNTTENVFLDVANTLDQKVIITEHFENKQFEIRNKLYADIQNEVLLLSDFKDDLKKRVVIFNITESAIGGHLIFVDEFKKLDLDKGENIIVMSPYELVNKAIKELLPTLLYGTSKPEILKIKSMESLFLIEAANFHSDLIIFPLTFYKQEFYTETLQKELTHRFKRIIVGPIPASELEKAKFLNPLGVILQD